MRQPPMLDRINPIDVLGFPIAQLPPVLYHVEMPEAAV